MGQIRPPMDRLFGANSSPLLADRGRRRRVDDAPNADGLRRPHHGHRTTHVHTLQLSGIRRAHRVDAGDVIDDLSSSEQRPQALSVCHVPPDR